jgi:hypothetical protein
MIGRNELTRLLKAAAAAHHEYETKLGQPDDNWPAWYADYIITHRRDEALAARGNPGVNQRLLNAADAVDHFNGR